MMRKWVGKLFKIYPEETKLFLWVVFIQFVMRASTSFINNYAQTAFLKRFGVEYLPTIFLINSFVVFLASNLLGLLMERHKIIRVFTGLLLFYALVCLAMRLLLPLNLTIIYPIIFIIKTQAMSTLPLLYWNINNALFSTRQSKRLFSLIMAGGILGAVLGSFFTKKISLFIGVDNILYVFVLGMILAAILNEKTESISGSNMEISITKKRKRIGPLGEFIKEIKKTSKSSPFLKYLIILVSMPNIVVPFMLYEFNVAVDQTYATESATLGFFSYFRGFANAITFLMLLISGRVISRVGVGTTLLFHPLNYLVAFGALFAKFDIFSAIYARLSTEALKTSFNIPSRAVLYNFIPIEVRSRIQVFLRGTVTKASSLIGSSMLMVSKNLLAPSYLGLVAVPFLIFWILSGISVRRKYPSLLIKVLMKGQIDWKELEEDTLSRLAQDKQTLQELKEGLLGDSPQISFLCGELLAYAKPPGWPEMLLPCLSKWPEMQNEFLELLSPQEMNDIWPDLKEITWRQPPEVLLSVVPILHRKLGSKLVDFLEKLTRHPDTRVRFQALLALYCDQSLEANAVFKRSIEGVLRALEDSGIPVQRRPSLEESFEESLKGLVSVASPDIGALAICGLGKMGAPESWDLALKFLNEPSKTKEASGSIMHMIEEMGDSLPVEVLIELLKSEDPQQRDLASRALLDKGPSIIPHIIGLLSSPSRTLRREILNLLEQLDISPVELSNYVQGQMRSAYLKLEYLSTTSAMETGSRAKELIERHLQEQIQETAEVILRVISVLEGGEKFRIILRAIQKRERKVLDNAIEALESSIKKDLRKGLVPLLDKIPIDEKLKIGRRMFGRLRSWSTPQEALFHMAMDEQDPIMRALVVYYWAEEAPLVIPSMEIIRNLQKVHDPYIEDALCWYGVRTSVAELQSPEGPQQPWPCIDKVFHIQKVPMFSDLRVKDLFSIARISQLQQADIGQILVREGDPGETLYLVVQGTLKVIKDLEGPHQREIATIGEGEYFGEMSLFDDQPRSASVITQTQAQLLSIDKRPFHDLMEHNPLIPINICRVFSKRIRQIHQRIQMSTLSPPSPP